MPADCLTPNDWNGAVSAKSVMCTHLVRPCVDHHPAERVYSVPYIAEMVIKRTGVLHIYRVFISSKD